MPWSDDSAHYGESLKAWTMEDLTPVSPDLLRVNHTEENGKIALMFLLSRNHQIPVLTKVTRNSWHMSREILQPSFG